MEESRRSRCIWDGPPKLVALAILGLWYQDRMGGLLEEASEPEKQAAQIPRGKRGNRRSNKRTARRFPEENGDAENNDVSVRGRCNEVLRLCTGDVEVLRFRARAMGSLLAGCATKQACTTYWTEKAGAAVVHHVVGKTDTMEKLTEKQLTDDEYKSAGLPKGKYFKVPALADCSRRVFESGRTIPLSCGLLLYSVDPTRNKISALRCVAHRK
jgi:hypothetical protein